MRQFLKFSLATVVGIFLFSLLSFLILLAIASTGSEEVKLKKDHVLKLNLNGLIYDRTTESPFENFDPFSGEITEAIGLHDLVNQIEKAKDHDKIKGILLEITYPQTGYASLREIRRALEDFQSSGKFVYAYSEGYTQRAYYLASVADSVLLNPEGAMEFKGLQAQVGFPLDFLAKIGVEPQVIRHGKYKSAVEPYLRNDMSPANKEQTEAFIGSIWDATIDQIAEGRGMSAAELNAAADTYAVFLGEDAVEAGLVDALTYRDEVFTMVRGQLDQEEDEEARFLSLNELKNVKDVSPVTTDYIAVIYAQGDIISGEGSEYQIGSGRISRAIRKARRDDKVKAIVLRVNSPGGDALASDVILREMEKAKAEKPVIVSMGDLAASGGYYISCKADHIFAEPTTITGSIGVFGVLFNPEELLNNKMGIHFDQVVTNAHADFGDPTRGLNDFEYARIQHIIEDIYADFIGHVADGREMDVADVDSIGQGRVWSGADALEIGLVDELGGINEALALAAERGEVEKYRIMSLPERKDPIQELIEELTGSMEVRAMKNKLGPLYPYFEQMEQLQYMHGYQARMPFTLELR